MKLGFPFAPINLPGGADNVPVQIDLALDNCFSLVFASHFSTFNHFNSVNGNQQQQF